MITTKKEQQEKEPAPPPTPRGPQTAPPKPGATDDQPPGQDPPDGEDPVNPNTDPNALGSKELRKLAEYFMAHNNESLGRLYSAFADSMQAFEESGGNLMKFDEFRAWWDNWNEKKDDVGGGEEGE